MFKPKTLSEYKICALNYGTNLILFEQFAEDTKLGNTNFPAGKYMEIVMCWMLGYFRRSFFVYLKVVTNAKMDKEGTDFTLTSSGKTISIDQKFDRDLEDDFHIQYPGHKIICVYPSKSGKSTSKRTMTGVEALSSILGAVLRPNIIERALSGRDEFTSLINNVWDKTSNGW